ncbi:MAG: hypothetical protein FD167_794 [bacterium]|nr:MAG: hypothetical protein FD167_794 [bacterium]
MLNKNTFTKILRTIVLIVFILINSLVAISQAQQKQEDKRDFIRIDKVKPEEFAKNRANPKAFVKMVQTKSKANTQENNIIGEVASLGLTLWNLRKSEADDTFRERNIIGNVIGTEKEEDLTPERVEGEPLKVEDGAYVRFSVESPVGGYLYVFDREQYVDGSYGVTYLVYPIKGVNNLEDNNQIKINQPIYIPRQKEGYYINLTKGNERKVVADVYTFLVSPSPLGLNPIKCTKIGNNTKGEAIIKCGIREVKKEEFDFEAKLKEWSSYTEVSDFNLKAQNHKKYKTMDKAEIKSLNNKANKLTVKSPPPQKVYTIARKPTEPYMLSIPIHYNDE